MIKMVNHVHFIIDDSLKEAIENDAKQRGQSETEWAREALEHFLNCKKAEPSVNMKLIVTRYDGHCLRCPEKIPAGSWALYAKGVGLICMDCYVSRIGDKAIIAKFLKMRELKKVINALSNEADRLVDKVEVFRASDKLEALVEQWEKLSKLAIDYLTSKLGRPEEQQAFEELMREKTASQGLIRDIEGFIEQYIKIRTKPSKKKKEIL